MGRKKIKIERIPDERNRSVCGVEGVRGREGTRVLYWGADTREEGGAVDGADNERLSVWQQWLFGVAGDGTDC